jgi:hypothetical protein
MRQNPCHSAVFDPNGQDVAHFYGAVLTFAPLFEKTIP